MGIELPKICLNLLKIALTVTKTTNGSYRFQSWVVTEPVTVTETVLKTVKNGILTDLTKTMKPYSYMKSFHNIFNDIKWILLFAFECISSKICLKMLKSYIKKGFNTILLWLHLVNFYGNNATYNNKKNLKLVSC